MNKILYIGKLDNIKKNLQDLGAIVLNKEAVDNSMEYCGTIITDSLQPNEINYKKPLIVSGNPTYNYKDINVLVLDEKEIEQFYKLQNISNLQTCKDKLKELGIHYLAIALGKEKIQKCIAYNLPKVQASQVKITKEDVAKAKDTLTAILGYIYIKEGTLSAEAIRKAQIGASLSISGFADNINLRDYYLNINLK